MEKLILDKDKRIKGGGEIKSIAIMNIDDINNKDAVLKLIFCMYQNNMNQFLKKLKFINN